MASWKLWLGNRANLGTLTMITNTEDATYPLSNVLDEDYYTIGKPADADDTIFRIDLGAAYSIEGWGVFNHTLGTQTATISLAYSPTDTSTDTWDGTPLTVASTYVSPVVDFAKAITGVTKRYWWVKIEGQDATVQIGTLNLYDNIRTLTRSPSLGTTREREFFVPLARTRGGVVHTEKWASPKRRWALPFNCLARTTDYTYLFDEIPDWTDIYRPFVLTDEYYSGASFSPAYMVYVDQRSFVSTVNKSDRYSMTLELVQA